MTMPMSRLIESEADYMGLLLMAAACFDINAAYAVSQTPHLTHAILYGCGFMHWLACPPDASAPASLHSIVIIPIA